MLVSTVEKHAHWVFTDAIGNVNAFGIQVKQILDSVKIAIQAGIMNWEPPASIGSLHEMDICINEQFTECQRSITDGETDQLETPFICFVYYSWIC